MKPETRKARQESMAGNVILELTPGEETVVLVALENQHRAELEYAQKCRARALRNHNTEDAEDDLRLAAAFEKYADDLAAVFKRIAGHDIQEKIR